MMFGDLDALWWSACVGCALWGVIITAVVLCVALLVTRAWRCEHHERRKSRQPGRL